MPDNLLEKLFTPAEVSASTGIAISTLAVWRSTKRYDLPYVKVGRSVRYLASDLEIFLRKRRQEPAPAA